MQWVSRSNHMGSIPVRVTMKRLPTPLGVGSLFISGLPVRESPGCPRCQFPTVISSKSLLPLQCPVSLLCRRPRLYLPPGGRCLGAMPQDGGSQREGNQFNHQRRNLPRVTIPMPHQGKSLRINRYRVWAIMSKYQPTSKPELHRPQAPSVTCGDSSLPEGAMGLYFTRWIPAFGERATALNVTSKMSEKAQPLGFSLIFKRI